MSDDQMRITVEVPRKDGDLLLQALRETFQFTDGVQYGELARDDGAWVVYGPPPPSSDETVAVGGMTLTRALLGDAAFNEIKLHNTVEGSIGEEHNQRILDREQLQDNILAETRPPVRTRFVYENPAQLARSARAFRIALERPDPPPKTDPLDGTVEDPK